MTFTTDELREALQAYAEDSPTPDAGSLIAGAQRKRDHARKVRVAVVAGVAAVLMAVVTVIGLHGIGREKALTPAQLNKKYHTHYAEYTQGLKLTNIVEVPVEHADDPNDAPPASDPSSVTLPSAGSNVYVMCDSATTGRTSASGDGIQTQLRSNGSAFAICDPAIPSQMGFDRPGRTIQLWLVTDARPKAHTAPVAIYSQVSWDTYPTASGKLDPTPRVLSNTSADGAFNVLFHGDGSGDIEKSVTVPAGLVGGASLAVSPSTPGRFQVLVNEKPVRLDDLPGTPARLVGFSADVRGLWYDYFPDSAEMSTGQPPHLTGPFPGTTARITIRAVDTTGPWTAQLSWQKK